MTLKTVTLGVTKIILQESTLEDNVVIKNEIRIKLGQGIAGMVALTGNTLNIPDAYKVRLLAQSRNENLYSNLK